jgi:hypothetical protein
MEDHDLMDANVQGEDSNLLQVGQFDQVIMLVRGGRWPHDESSSSILFAGMLRL